MLNVFKVSLTFPFPPPTLPSLLDLVPQHRLLLFEIPRAVRLSGQTSLDPRGGLKSSFKSQAGFGYSKLSVASELTQKLHYGAKDLPITLEVF